MATQGGIYIYYLISTYYTTWPLIFFGLLTVLAAAFSHGGKYLMKDLSDMSKLPLTHYINSHLSVLYITVIPIFLSVSTYHYSEWFRMVLYSFAFCLQCSLGYCLFNIAGEHIAQPLKNFKMTLPKEWGMPLGWSLTFIPILIILAGLLFHVIWKSRGIPFKMVSLIITTCHARHFMKKLL